MNCLIRYKKAPGLHFCNMIQWIFSHFKWQKKKYKSWKISKCKIREKKIGEMLKAEIKFLFWLVTTTIGFDDWKIHKFLQQFNFCALQNLPQRLITQRFAFYTVCNRAWKVRLMWCANENDPPNEMEIKTMRRTKNINEKLSDSKTMRISCN